MLVTLLAHTDGPPSAEALLAGITALSRITAVKRVEVHSSPWRYNVDVDGQIDPATLAAALGEALDLAVQVQTGA